jgi:hypothetical protein
LNNAGLGQPLNPAPTRGFGKPHFFTDLFGGQRAVALQDCQDFLIDSIHATKSSIETPERNSVAQVSVPG